MSALRSEGLHARKVLLLQGPVGPFFHRLARELRATGAEVHKVNFNGGDWLFYPRGAVTWRGHPSDWPEFLQSLLIERQIDVMLLFGDCRPIHYVAREVAARLGVQVGVFEEGYIRPNFITFEDFGVNGYSRLPRRPEFYRQLPRAGRRVETEVRNAFRYSAFWATLYYIASAVARPRFPHYRHHRPLTLSEAWPWLRSAWRKVLYRLRERGILERLTGSLRGKFFLVPLQVSVDAQVRHHSDFCSVRYFIQHVLASFAAHAPGDALLVVKHHPLARGHQDYGRMLAALTAEFGLAGRVLYIHDQFLPTLLDCARGVVLINSTAGLTALERGVPVKPCGLAVYDIRGLTFQGPLDEFWGQADSFRPDAALFQRFSAHLIERTQINGNFYGRAIGSTAEAAAFSVCQPPSAARAQHHGTTEELRATRRALAAASAAR